MSVWQNQISFICEKCREAVVKEQTPQCNWKLTWFLSQAACLPCLSQRLKTQDINNNYYKSTRRFSLLSYVRSRTSPLMQSLVVWHNWKERLPFFLRSFQSTSPLLFWSPWRYLPAGSWGRLVQCSRRCTWPRTLCGYTRTTKFKSKLFWILQKNLCSYVNLRYLLQTLRALLGKGKAVFHWVGSLIPQYH